MAFWTPTRYETKPVIQALGDGINTGLPPFQIADSEATYLRNFDSREYPALAVRPPRSTYATALSTDIGAIGQRSNSVLHVAAGNTWKYWNTATTAYVDVTTTLSSSSPGEFGEFATGTNRYTIYMNSTQKLIWDGTSTALVLGTSDAPFTNKFAVHRGRIYALRDNDIKFCGLNATSDWTSSNAGTIDVTGAKGTGSGIYTYGDHVIVFTEYSMHELYGTFPQYTLIDIEGQVGCISHRSITTCNSKLYWLWFDGIYEYNGGRVIKISDALDSYINNINLTYKTKCVSGSIGDYLYMAIPHGSSATNNNLLLKYDTRLKKSYVEEGSFVDFVTIGNVLYGVDVNGQLWNMRDTSATEGLDGTTPISWDFITKPFNENAIGEKKTLTEMYFVVDRPTSSTSFDVSYSTNVENTSTSYFTNLTTNLVTASSNITNTRVQLPLSAIQNVNWYRLRLKGTGYSVVHYLQKNLRVRRR